MGFFTTSPAFMAWFQTWNYAAPRGDTHYSGSLIALIRNHPVTRAAPAGASHSPFRAHATPDRMFCMRERKPRGPITLLCERRRLLWTVSVLLTIVILSM